MRFLLFCFWLASMLPHVLFRFMLVWEVSCGCGWRGRWGQSQYELYMKRNRSKFHIKIK
jgi:hypothetical protein